MSYNASWAPQVPPQAILVEKLVLEGVFLGCVAYGVLLLLFIQTAFLILSSRPQNRQTLFRFLYVFALFACGTITVGSGIKTTELAYIDNRNIPGGPTAFGEEFSAIPVTTMGFCAFIVAVWLQDGYLLYRFLVIWNWNWPMFVTPCLMYLATIALSTVLLIVETNTNSSFWIAKSVKLIKVFPSLLKAFWTISISLNVILTALIVGRLLFLKKRIQRVFGVAYAQMYTSISALLIESAALYSVFAFMWLVMLLGNIHLPQNIVFPIVTIVELIAPMLISYRVALGRAFTDEITSCSTNRGFTTTIQSNALTYPSSAQYNSTAIESYGTHGRSFYSIDSRRVRERQNTNEKGDRVIELTHIRNSSKHETSSDAGYSDVV